MKKETLEKIKKDLEKKGFTLIEIKDSQIIYERPNKSIGVDTFNDDPSMTQQHMETETDINHIIEKYQRAPNPAIFVKAGKGVYGDFTDAKDYHTSLNIILQAEDAFMSLDAKIRKEFDNDPAKLLAAINDPSQLERLEKLGLVEKSIKNATTTNDDANIKDSTKQDPVQTQS